MESKKCAKCKKDIPIKDEENYFCSGCKNYICGETNCGEAPFGSHTLEEHTLPCRNCGDRIDGDDDDLCQQCLIKEDANEPKLAKRVPIGED